MRACLASCGWCDDVHVVDSGSTDRTVEIAESMGATVHHHPFTSFGEQRNWAIDHVPAKHEWIFHLDADERFTPPLVEEMARRLASDPGVDAFHAPQKLMMMGRWLKRAGGYPIYQVRLFHKRRMRFIDYGHGQREDPAAKTAVLEEPYEHHAFSKGVFEWIEKHNRYSTLEALQVVSGERGQWSLWDLIAGSRIKRWRAWKEFLYRVPGRPWIRMAGVLLLHGGIIEGKAGWTYARLIGLYERMISIKLKLMRSRAVAGAVKAGAFETERMPEASNKVFDPGQRVDALSARAARATQPIPDRRHSRPPAAGEHVPQMQPEPSPWSFREKAVRAIWMTLGRPLFRVSFHNWYRFRASLLRLFGARVGRHTAIRPTARIEVPWMLTVDDDASIGDYAIVYCLGPTYIGKRAIISQYAHLCAGTHDYTDHTFKLIRSPITIGNDVWIGTDAFIGPGVTIGELTVVGARSSLYKDAEPGKVYVGNPAKPIKDRELR